MHESCSHVINIISIPTARLVALLLKKHSFSARQKKSLVYVDSGTVVHFFAPEGCVLIV